MKLNKIKNNFYKKRNKKNNLTKHELAIKLNTDVEKIEKLETGELEIGGNTFEKYIETTNISKAEINLEYAKLLEWYKKTDFQDLRYKFGYHSQSAFVNKCKIPQSSYSMIENKNTIKPSYSHLLKLYNFFNNDFNKEINVKDETSFKIDKVSPIILTKEQVSNLNWKDIISKSNCLQITLAKKMGISPSTLSLIINGHSQQLRKNTRIVISNYLYSINYIDDKGRIILDLTEPIEEEQEEVKMLKVNVDNTSKVVENKIEDTILNDIQTYDTTLADVDNSNIKMTFQDFMKAFQNVNYEEYQKLKDENEILKQKIKRYEKILDKLLV